MMSKLSDVILGGPFGGYEAFSVFRALRASRSASRWQVSRIQADRWPGLPAAHSIRSRHSSETLSSKATGNILPWGRPGLRLMAILTVYHPGRL